MTEEQRLAIMEAIAPVSVQDEAGMMAKIIAVPIEVLPAIGLKITEYRKTFQRLEATYEARLRAEWQKLLGDDPMKTTWQHPETGEQYLLDGSSGWEVKDAAGLKNALETAIVELNPAPSSEELAKIMKLIHAAFVPTYEVKHQPLNSLALLGASFSNALHDFRTRKYGPTHLVSADTPEGKR